MYIVLTTRGKNDSVDYIEINLFEKHEDAEKFRIENTDSEKQKYWTYSEIIEQAAQYEPCRYKNR